MRSTYDFMSHYRAAAVFKFFEEQKLTPPRLREPNQYQIELLSGGSRNDNIGGFLAIPVPHIDATSCGPCVRAR